MGITFFNPALLLGGLAIIAPIIIFLLTRYRYRTVEWAALTFLQRAFKKQQRRLRVENLLLLLIRCLVLLLFALALARPRAQAGTVDLNDADVRKNVLVAIDGSYSMGYQLGSDDAETAFERARRSAKEIVGGLEASDRLMVVVFDEEVRNLFPLPRQMDDTGRDDVTQELDDATEGAEVRRTERGTDLTGLFQELPRLLEKFDLGPDGQPPPEGSKPLKKTLYLLTDAQRTGVLDPEGNLANQVIGRAAKEIHALGAQIVLVDCGAEDPRNVSVTRFGPIQPVVGQDLPCTIEASIKNWSSSPMKDLTVEYFVDGATTPQKIAPSLTIPPGEERSPEEFSYVFKEPGPHRVEILVKSDGLVLDNVRHVVIDVRRDVRVLIVDGEPGRTNWESETYFLAEALGMPEVEDGRGLIQPEVVDEGQLTGRKLSDFDVVFMANVPQVTDEAIAALETYARQGGAVVFTMGGMVDPTHYNEHLWRRGAGLFPCALKEMRGTTFVEAQDDRDAPSWVMTVADPHHPVASIFTSEEMLSWLKRPQVFGYFTVDLAGADPRPDEPPTSVPFRLVPRVLGANGAPVGGDDGTPSKDDGEPLVVEKPYGRGRAVLWLSTVDYGWNNCLTQDGFYLPFWRQLALDLTQRSRPALNLEIGSRYERLLRAEDYGKVEVETPDGRHEQVPIEKLEDQEMYRVLYPPEGDREVLEMSGLYALSRTEVAGASADPAPEHFAVTIDPGEGDLSKFSAEELTDAFEGVPKVEEVPHGGVREVLASAGGGSGATEFWREAIAGVIFLMVLESVLAALFGRGRR